MHQSGTSGASEVSPIPTIFSQEVSKLLVPDSCLFWKGGEWSTLFTHVCTFAVSTLLVSPPSLPRPRYSQKVDSELFQQMSECLLCARHCVGVSKAKWK